MISDTNIRIVKVVRENGEEKELLEITFHVGEGAYRRPLLGETEGWNIFRIAKDDLRSLRKLFPDEEFRLYDGDKCLDPSITL